MFVLIDILIKKLIDDFGGQLILWWYQIVTF